MPFARRRRDRRHCAADPIFIVMSGREIQQVFARLADAERFVDNNPNARISRHLVRTSVDQAVVIFDRRVVVVQGSTVMDRTNVIRHFIDDPLDAPESADVEWYQDSKDAGWHITGFGIDKAALDVRIQDAIDQLRPLSRT